ncbi:MAG: 30S ribosomal protein S15 [Elusimicrobiota bacterium]
MTMTKEKTSEIVSKFRTAPKDTGGTPVQVALLTERIRYLSDHLRTHRKDHASQLGLLKLVSQRRRLLAYIKRRDLSAYSKLINKLNLRK